MRPAWLAAPFSPAGAGAGAFVPEGAESVCTALWHYCFGQRVLDRGAPVGQDTVSLVQSPVKSGEKTLVNAVGLRPASGALYLSPLAEMKDWVLYHCTSSSRLYC